MATAPGPWPFLALLTSPRDDEPRRVHGLGFAHGGAIVTLPHIAERAADAELPGGPQLAVTPAKTRSGVALVAPAEPPGASAGLGAADGQPVSVALANDDNGSIRIGQGQIERAGDRSVFVLDGRIGDYWSPSGSPIVQEDGTVVGIVGATSTNNVLDMFGIEDIERLLEPEPELTGGVSADLVDPTVALPLTADHLDVGVEVTMFAALIANVDTRLPLSIGLFGPWGSGKSYFMALLRAQIASLAGSSDSRYHREIVQIGFNAWSYADSNLWASLGDEIFAQLAGPSAADDEKARREALQEDLDDKLQWRRELAEAAARAEAEKERLATDLQQARTDRWTRAKALAEAVLQDPDARDALGRLGVSKQADQIQLLAGELEGSREDAEEVRRAVTRLPRGAIAAGVAVAALAIAAGVAASKDLAGLGVAVVALLTTAGAVAERLRSGMLALRRFADALRRGEKAAVAGQVTALRKAETNERALRSQLDDVIQQVSDINHELTELAPGQRLYRFVAERAASDTYRGQLGLISTIRRDLEQLRKLMREDWPASEDDARRPIDRIVLYIDDLDRCSPDQVVEVLQAVHLLLAIDLFVVVVGVDPRWLLHSLRREYRSLLTASPEDYLEKIFNIPFALPRMTPTTFGRLVSSFVELDSGGALDTPLLGAVSEELPVAEEHSEVAELQAGAAPAERRELTVDELDMLTALAPLVETPREAKRLMNLYRMLRSTRDLSPAARFLGDERTPGEYQAVVILLGLLSGHARLLHDVLVAPATETAKGGLRGRAKEETWAAFAAGLKPRDGSVNDVVGAIPAADLEQWALLSKGLEGATKLVTIPDLAPFQAWAPRVARFSFLLSPYAGADES